MGNVTAKNTVNAVTQAMIDITNQQMTTSNVTETVANDVVISGNCSFKGNVVNQGTNFTVNETIMQSGSFQDQVSASISQQISQVAEAISQSLTLNPGSTTAQNIANAIVNSKTNLTNQYIESFNTAFSAQNALTCTGGTVTGNVFNQEITNQEIIDATNLADSTSGVTLQIQQAVSQSATAKQEDSMIFLMIIIVAIVIAIVGTGGTVVTNLTKPQFIATMAPLAIGIGYLIFAYSASIWPLASCQ